MTIFCQIIGVQRLPPTYIVQRSNKSNSIWYWIINDRWCRRPHGNHSYRANLIEMQTWNMSSWAMNQAIMIACTIWVIRYRAIEHVKTQSNKFTTLFHSCLLQSCGGDGGNGFYSLIISPFSLCGQNQFRIKAVRSFKLISIMCLFKMSYRSPQTCRNKMIRGIRWMRSLVSKRRCSWGVD